MQNADLLIRTKLHRPFTRTELVSRTRLQEQIAQGLSRPLTLITAPAGFGKTTLVVASISQLGMPSAWYSLDKEDNHPVRFLRYLIAAIEEVDGSIGIEAAQLLEGSQHTTPDIILTCLINDLDRASKEMVLVLDDYHFINNQAVHEAVTFLLDHCPRHFYLLISTRSDPPLPLSRLRARGQIVELRAADLRFSETEAVKFLNDSMGLQLNSASIALLEERTEGWIAGLQMAALALRGTIALRQHPSNSDQEIVPEFIQRFSGTNRYILDYLLEEILSTQTLEIQCFLLFTSVLERLTAPLCDAVLAASKEFKDQNGDLPIAEQVRSLPHSFEILEYLERSNLFLISLDDVTFSKNARWFRYHHLFADLLHARLDQLYPGLAKQLRLRAMAWLEQAGFTIEAVNQALVAGDHDHAARLVEENTTQLMAQGELNALMSWIEVLPTELRLKRPWLCIHQAYAILFAARTAHVEQLLTLAETSAAAGSDPHNVGNTGQPDKPGPPLMSDAEVRSLQGAIATARAYKAVISGQDFEALSHLQEARTLLTIENGFEQVLCAYALGHTMLTLGRLPEAHSAFQEYIRLGRVSHNPWVVLAGQSFIAQVFQAQGKLSQALAFLQEALAEAAQQGVSSRAYIARALNSKACVLYEQNEIEAADHLLSEAIELTRNWPNPNHLVYSFALQARIQVALGHLEEARTAIEKANQIRRNAYLVRRLHCTVESEMVRVWLALQAAGAACVPGDPLVEQSTSLVARWKSELTNLEVSNDQLLDECTETVVLTLARVSLAAGRVEEALNFIEPVTQKALAAGHISTAIRSLILSALAWQGKTDRGVERASLSCPAFTALEKALNLAAPEGYVRTFLDEGQPIQNLLVDWLVNVRDNPLRFYANRLLAQFNTSPLSPQRTAVPAVQDQFASINSQVDRWARTTNIELVEPISPRELEILHLMALGCTNQAIASQLVVATGTIKAHAASIYRKLDVANRTEAVARARQLGMLP